MRTIKGGTRGNKIPRKERTMNYDEIFARSKKAAFALKNATTEIKNKALTAISDALKANVDKIEAANALDVAAAEEAGTAKSMIDRLTYRRDRILSSASDVMKVVELKDPVGEILDDRIVDAGFRLRKQRVPFGVIGIIYEARPNVTVDVAVLCVKTGNACLLKGGSNAANTNEVLAEIIRNAITDIIPEDSVILMPSDRDATAALISARGKVDLLVPRGSKRLIQYVLDNAKVPVIETGAGVCHLYVDNSADFDKALKILDNGKTQRPSVCNALETLLVHKDVADKFIPLAIDYLKDKGVIFRGEEETARKFGLAPLTENGFYTEYGDLEISVKVVEDVLSAVEHVNRYGTGHSDCVIAEDDSAAAAFINGVDSACVYRNVSTRFSDGGCFGFGAELGISTQKLHARGPMGLAEMTSYRYVLIGDGEVRK